MPSFVPFTITDGATPLAAELSLVGGRPDERDERTLYRYDGPFGPVFGAVDLRSTRTRWRGPHVPETEVAVGADLTDPIRTAADLRAGIDGHIGGLALHVRRTPEHDTRTVREIVARLGPGAYVLRSAGLLPKVALHAPSGDVVASYTVRGRRPHGLADDATPAEALLALVLTSFAPRLAYAG